MQIHYVFIQNDSIAEKVRGSSICSIFETRLIANMIFSFQKWIRGRRASRQI